MSEAFEHAQRAVGPYAAHAWPLFAIAVAITLFAGLVAFFFALLWHTTLRPYMRLKTAAREARGTALEVVYMAGPILILVAAAAIFLLR